ncbi:MAG: F0F1 ATP synthase subunit B [Beijerinckiaceae bacterium]
MATPADGAQNNVGFPPFDTSTFASQLFWFAIVFGTLYWMMAKVIIPRLSAIVDGRKARIAKDLDEAAQMQAKAQVAGEAYEKALADARANAQTIAQSTRDKLNAETEARRKAVDSELAAKLQASEAQVAAMKNRAMENVGAVAAEAVGAILDKLIGKSADAGTVASALKSVMGR